MSPPLPERDALDGALQHALEPPALPAGFRARLQSRMVQEALRDIESRRAEIEHEHARTLLQLRNKHVLMQRDTLAMVVGVAFAAGVAAYRVFPWLESMVGTDAAVALPTLAIAAGMLALHGALPGRNPL